MIRPIYLYGEDILRQRAEEVDLNDPELPQIIEDMFDTMRAANGAGLAAPQIGINKRIIVIEETMNDGSLFKGVFINPKILKTFGEDWTIKEGCLSFPGVVATISRPTFVMISWHDEHKEYHCTIFSVMRAKIIQHEIDHLNGTLLVDKMNFEEKAKQFKLLEDIKNKKVEVSYDTG